MARVDGLFGSGGGSLSSLGSTLTNVGTSVLAKVIPGASGGLGSATAVAKNAVGLATMAGRSTAPEATIDQRVRLRPLAAEGFYAASGIMDPLKPSGSNGVIFPYTPTVTFSQSVEYSPVSLVHTNMDIQAYQRTPSAEIGVTGKFSVQNQREGLYALAALHFMRAASKMHFGAKDKNAGLPPPMLLLSGYGTYMFNDLRVVLKSHSFQYDETMDTVGVNYAGRVTRLPALFTLSVTLAVQITPLKMRKEFSFDEFASGSLMAKKGWI